MGQIALPHVKSSAEQSPPKRRWKGGKKEKTYLKRLFKCQVLQQDQPFQQSSPLVIAPCSQSPFLSCENVMGKRRNKKNYHGKLCLDNTGRPFKAIGVLCDQLGVVRPTYKFMLCEEFARNPLT